MAKWTAWTKQLMEAGQLAGAQALSHPPTGKVLRGRERVVTDGPYAESKDLVSGTLVVVAASLDEAAEMALVGDADDRRRGGSFTEGLGPLPRA